MDIDADFVSRTPDLTFAQIHRNRVLSRYCKVCSIATHQDKSRFYISNAYGSIYAYDLDVNSMEKLVDGEGDHSPIYSLTVCGPLLIGGLYDSLRQWNFPTGDQSSAVTLDNEVKLGFDARAVNDVLVLEERTSVLAATGSGCIVELDAVSLRTKSLFASDDNSCVHCLRKFDERCVVSSTEDGRVTLWDLRTAEGESKICCFRPCDDESLSKSLSGRHINCLAVDNNGCVVCGGGPHLSMWHVRTMSMVNTFPMSGTCPQSVVMMANKVLGGSTNGKLHQWDYTGRLEGSCETRLSTVCALGCLQGSGADEVVLAGGIGPSVGLYSRGLLCLKTIGMFKQHA